MQNNHSRKLRFPYFQFTPFYFLSLFILLTFSCQESSTSPSQPIFTFDQLMSTKPLELKITTDMNTLFEKGEDEGFQEAYCKMQKREMTIHEGTVKVSKRGITRKKICDLPPVKLKIGKGKSKFKLKIVAPCHTGVEYQQLVYKEYLTYQMYHQLTDYSFRTQLVNITYEDSEGIQAPIEMMGFVIEDDKEVAIRMAADVMPKEKKLKFIDQDCYRLFTMFQYCIGNTDWNLTRRHNIKMICKKNSQTPIPVPYDFDYAGLVNAPYAIPHPQLPIKNVRQRHFMWRGKNKGGFGEIIKKFELKKNDLFSVVQSFPYLEENEKVDMVNYLEGFYQHLQDNVAGIIS